MEVVMEPVRAKVVARFEAVLEDATLARHLEICLFNWTIRTCVRDRIPRYWTDKRFRYRYTTRALSLAFNLRHPRNPSLGDRVRARELPLKKFANMMPEDMFPGLYDEVRSRLAALQLRRMAISHKDAPDGRYSCRSCKSKKTQYTCLQTRSADEPETIYVSCLECGKRWKN